MVVQAPGLSPAQQAAQANNVARAMIAGNIPGIPGAIDVWQLIYSQTLASPSGNITFNVVPRNVGLIKNFVVEVAVTFSVGAVTLTRTQMGPANILSSVVFSDLNNNQRINTTGWHLSALATARRRRVAGSAYTTDSPIGYGSVVNTGIQCAASYTGAGSTTMNMVYEIPVAYSDDDLRGAIYANVLNSVMNLQLNVNTAPVVASGTDATTAVFSSSGAIPTISSITVNVYQNYLDQLPMGKQGPIIPMQDLQNVYLLNSTNYTGMAANQEFPIPFANFRDFYSATIIYDQNGTLNAGTDINYFALQSANFTNIFKKDATLLSYQTRNLLGDDMPKGCYYFDFRRRPISTLQYGNMELIVNPSSVAGSSIILAGFEALAIQNAVAGAGSLVGG